LNQLSRKSRELIKLTFCGSVFDDDVMALNVPKLVQALPKRFIPLPAATR
jgi:hypothetical protein